METLKHSVFPVFVGQVGPFPKPAQISPFGVGWKRNSGPYTSPHNGQPVGSQPEHPDARRL